MHPPYAYLGFSSPLGFSEEEMATARGLFGGWLRVGRANEKAREMLSASGYNPDRPPRSLDVRPPGGRDLEDQVLALSRLLARPRVGRFVRPLGPVLQIVLMYGERLAVRVPTSVIDACLASATLLDFDIQWEPPLPGPLEERLTSSRNYGSLALELIGTSWPDLASQPPPPRLVKSGRGYRRVGSKEWRLHDYEWTESDGELRARREVRWRWDLDREIQKLMWELRRRTLHGQYGDVPPGWGSTLLLRVTGGNGQPPICPSLNSLRLLAWLRADLQLEVEPGPLWFRRRYKPDGR